MSSARSHERRLVNYYGLWNVQPADIRLLNMIAHDKPSLEELSDRIIDELHSGKFHFASLVDHFDGLDTITMITMGMRLSIDGMLRAINSSLDRSEEIIHILLDEYDEVAIHPLCNLLVEHNASHYIQLLPAYFPLDRFLDIQLDNRDRSQVLQALIDMRVDRAYLSYLVNQSISQDLSVYTYLAQSGVELLVACSMDYVTIRRLSNIPQHNIRFIISFDELHPGDVDSNMRRFLSINRIILDSEIELQDVIEEDDVQSYSLIEGSSMYANIIMTSQELLNNNVMNRILHNRRLGMIEWNLTVELHGHLDNYSYMRELNTYLIEE